MKNKPILCLDFDGVLHHYTSGWSGPGVISDGPTPGAKEFVFEALDYFHVVIYSSRSKFTEGIFAMQEWFKKHEFPSEVEFASEKPAAFMTIDDRAFQFRGVFPNPEELVNYKPWNKGENFNKKEELFQELEKTCNEANEKGWDENDAEPYNEDSKGYASRLISVMPLYDKVGIPELSVDYDGEIVFSWFISPEKNLEIEISSTGTLHYSGVFYEESMTGQEKLLNEFPGNILFFLNKIYK